MYVKSFRQRGLMADSTDRRSIVQMSTFQGFFGQPVETKGQMDSKHSIDLLLIRPLQPSALQRDTFSNLSASDNSNLTLIGRPPFQVVIFTNCQADCIAILLLACDICML